MLDVHVIKDSELLLLFTGTFRVLCIIVQDGFIFQILNEVVHQQQDVYFVFPFQNNKIAR